MGDLSVFAVHEPAVGRGRFFGREPLVRALAEGLDRRRSFALCGGPRTGRTSTLLHVIDQVKAAWTRQSQSRRHASTRAVPVYLDLATVQNERDFPVRLWKAVTEAIRDPLVAGESPPEHPSEEFRRQRDTWQHFEDLADDAWFGMRGTTAWCEIGLYLDNADRLFERPLRELPGRLAAWVQGDTDWAPRSITAAGGRSLREHLLIADAELRFMRPLLLGPLRDAEAENLIRAGFPDLDPDSITSLLATTGKHPFALQRVLMELAQRGLDIGIEGAVEACAHDLLDVFELLWADFDHGRGVTYRGAYAAPEHVLMQLLCDFSQGCDVNTAEKELGLKPLKEFAEFLEYEGVAERVLLGNDTLYRAQFELWNIWYGERVAR